MASALLPNGLLCHNVAVAEELASPPLFYSVESLYRRKWRWDRIVKSSHGRSNCMSACSWDVYVRDGVIWREEQNSVYESQQPGVPDFNPRGCQKGACYSEQTYSPLRLLHPMKRIGPRGSGRWERISWEEAYSTIADRMIDVLVQNKPQRIVYDHGTTNVDFGPDQMWEQRLFTLLSCTELDSWGLVGDEMMGAIQTLGMQNIEGTSDDWFHSDYIVILMGNPVYTRIPDAHFMTEARYNGARLVCLSPDYSATASKADLWVPIEPRTDAAFAMAAAHVIINEKRYDEDYLIKHTDLPFLIREDNRQFLRVQDLQPEAEGKFRYYAWDLRRNGPFEMPGCWDHAADNTRLPDDVEIVLDGRFEVTLANGTRIKVRTNWNAFAQRVQKWSPEAVAKETRVHPQVIRQFARDFASARSPMIYSSWGAGKGYHSDLEQRLKILLCAMAGSHGKPGGGFRVAGWFTPEGWPWVAYGDYDVLSDEYWKSKAFLKVLEATGLDANPSFLRLLFNVMPQDPVYFEEVAQTAGMTSIPAIPFYYKLEPDWQHTMGEVEDRTYPRRLAEYFQEAMTTEGYESNPHMREAEIPEVFFYTGSNPLRRLWRHDAIEKGMWQKIGLIVHVTPQINYSSLHSDILLPAAGWYEKLGLKYTQTYLPYLVINDKVIEPLGQSKCEYIIAGELAKTISERAVARGESAFTDLFGRKKDLSKIYDRWSYGGNFEPTDAGKEKGYDFLLRISAVSNPYFVATLKQKGMGQALAEAFDSSARTTLADMRREGAVAIRSTGNYTNINAIGSEKEEGKTITPHLWFIRDHWRYPTATGRMQFYIDHPWYLEADEAMPTYKPSPVLLGSQQPFYLSGGHTRWSIHSQWRENPTLLRLQRGEPVLWVSVEDARDLEVEDGEIVSMFNEFGSCLCQVKVAAAARPGTVIMYHAWQPWQFRNGVSDKTLYGSPIKPLHMAGNYCQLNYRMAGAQPGHVPRDTRVGLRKLSR